MKPLAIRGYLPMAIELNSWWGEDEGTPPLRDNAGKTVAVNPGWGDWREFRRFVRG